MNTYICLDAEFGGIGMEYSLLTFHFDVYDDKFELTDSLSLFVQPNDKIFHVCGEAMGINKIDLYSHSLKAITYKEAGTKLYQFISKNSDSGKNKLVPIGHGMTGDLLHIFDKLMSRDTWETFVSYRRLDTSVVLQFLKSCGKFPEDVSGSLESLAKYFNLIEDVNVLHDCEVDTKLTWQVFLKLRGLITATGNPITFVQFIPN